MKCPNCDSKINIFIIRHDFLCKYCGIHLIAKNIYLALFLSLILTFTIASPLLTIIFEGKLVAFIIELIICMLITCLFFKFMVKIDRGNE